MNASDFRHFYDYHFTLNRRLWDRCIVPLSDEQFKQKLDYSVGSIRNQMVHLLNIDDRWFSGLRGEPLPGFLNPVHYPDRAVIREMWDDVESKMRVYLHDLKDEQLQTPFERGMTIGHVLFHVLNHGTDHRAQTLAMLHTFGVQTFPQDFVFFAFGMDV